MVPNGGCAPLLSMRGVAKSYAAGVPGCLARVRVLRSVSLDVRAGEVVALTGGAGAGKTTLLLCAAALLRPDGGLVLWSGIPPSPLERRSVALVAATPSFLGYLTAGDVLSLYGGARTPSDRPLPFLARRAGIARRLQLRVSQLDRCDLRRLALACALAQRARLLLIDEPPASEGWDPLLLSAAAECADRGGAVLIATRTSFQVRPYVSRAAALWDGVLECGDPAAAAPAIVVDERPAPARPHMVAESGSPAAAPAHDRYHSVAPLQR